MTSENFNLIDRSAEGFFAKHPKDGIKAEVSYNDVPKSTTVAGPLKGSVKVLVGGTAETLEIKDLLTHPTTALKDPQLAAVGVVAKFTRREQNNEIDVGVELSGKGLAAFTGLELIGADGTKLKGGTTSMSGMGEASFTKSATKEDLKGATLKLNFREGGKIAEIPFNLPEVKVGN